MIENDQLRKWFLIVFAFFCIGINVIAFVLYEKNQGIEASKQWVSHTYEVLTHEYALFSNIQDMETSQRGFLLTGEERFLGPFNIAKDELADNLGDLRSLTKDNPVRAADIESYQKVIMEMGVNLVRQIDERRQSTIVRPSEMDTNKALMDQVRLIHQRIVDDETALLAQRRSEAQRKQQNYVSTIFISAIVSAIALLIANAFIALLTYRRKFAEEDLRRTNKEMEGFTYIASHDLRSPLVNLKGFSSEMRYSIDELKPLIEKASLPESDMKKMKEIVEKELPDSLHYIHSSVEKMDKLTNAILELSRLGRRKMEIETLDTKILVDRILDTFHHTINTKGVKVTVLPLPQVMSDRLSLEQVFSNVIDNAIKYLDPERPGVIEIGAVKNYRETKFWVKDNGRGIAATDNQKIFEIYRRAGNTEEIPGEGMGMAYVRTTLRRLGGQIWCTSAPNLGTTFYFTISNDIKKG